MIATPHATASLLATILLERSRKERMARHSKKWYALIAFVSFASHFLLDGIPHYGYRIYHDDPVSVYKLGLDFFFTFCVFVFVLWPQIKMLPDTLRYPASNRDQFGTKEKLYYIDLILLAFWGIFFSWLPDTLTVVSYYYKIFASDSLQKIHYFFHSPVVLDVWIGLFWQIVFCSIAIVIARGQAQRIANEIRIEEQAELAGEEFKQFVGTSQK